MTINEIAQYDRICIFGNNGSGKSHLARQLAAQTGRQVIHLDQHFWLPGWVKLPRNERFAMQQTWLAQPRWIIEGNWSGSFIEQRFAAADLAILLDTPRLLCIWRLIKRRGRARSDLREGCAETKLFSRAFLKLLAGAWRYNKERRPKVLALHEKYPEVTFEILRH